MKVAELARNLIAEVSFTKKKKKTIFNTEYAPCLMHRWSCLLLKSIEVQGLDISKTLPTFQNTENSVQHIHIKGMFYKGVEPPKCS